MYTSSPRGHFEEPFNDRDVAALTVGCTNDLHEFRLSQTAEGHNRDVNVVRHDCCVEVFGCSNNWAELRPSHIGVLYIVDVSDDVKTALWVTG